MKYNLEKLIKKHKWYYVNSDITEKNFPLPKKIETENPVILKFDNSFSSEEALERCKKEGLRPANIYELLLLKENHPENWPDNTWSSILAFGSQFTDSDGDHRVPLVRAYSDGVFWFSLGDFGRDWASDYCLLCVCDKTFDC